MTIVYRTHLFVIAGLIAAASASGQDGSWNVDAAGNWTDAANWASSQIATGADNTATFGNVISANRTVTLNGDRTIGNITASDTTDNYTISGANILTLDRTSGVPTIDVTTAGRILTISSQIAGNDGLQKNGSGTLTISTTAPTYTGATILNGGTLNVSGLAGNPLSSSSGITFTGTSTLTVAAATLITPSMSIDPGVTANFNYPASGTGSLVFTIPSLSGSGTFSADNPGGSGQGKTVAFTDLSAFTGVLQMNLTGAALQFRVFNLNDTVANNIRFAGNGGAVNQTNRFNYVGSAGLTLTNRAFEFANGANAFLAIQNNGTANSALLINSNLAVTAAGNKTLQLSGSNTGGTSTFAGTINNGTSAVISLTKIDGNTWSLTNTANTFSGAITFGVIGQSFGNTNTAPNGTLNYASAGGANPITFNLTTGSATLAYTGSTDKIMSGAITASALTTGTITLSSTGAGAVNYSNTASLGSAGSGNKNLVLSGTNTGNNTFAGQWVNNTGGAATLTKNGAGKWILSGANSYTGATTINGGTLAVNGSLAAGSTVTVNSGGTLGGDGLISGSVIANGSLAPGNSIGTLEIGGNLTWNAGTNWVFELGPGDTADLVDITGAFTRGTGSDGAFMFDFAGSTATGTFVLVDFASTSFSDGNAFDYTNLGGGNTGSFNLTGSQLQFVVVPEPTTIALLGAGLALVGLTVARRRKA